jgi:hypothetical protein
MTQKERRIIEHELATLFSEKAFLVFNTIEELKRVGLFHPSVRTDTNTHPLSDAGISALRRITGIMQRVPELRDSCSPKEIAGQVHESYEGWIKQSLQPDAAEFTKECFDALLSTVKEHIHLVTLEGLELSDLDRLELGRVSICKPDMAILSEVQFGGAITEDWIQGEFAKGLWLIGRSSGSPEISFQRFEHHTILTIGILAVCGAILFEGSIWQSHLRAALSPHRQTMPTSIFRWEAGGANPTVTRVWGEDKKLPLNVELIAYLRNECFLDQLTELPVLNQKTELQESIERALYWFADAHGDRNTTMRFIKLWSCAECFFAITDKDVTEANARGMATILTFAGYGVWKVADYPKLKRRLKELYNLRSRAVHRAEFNGVQLQDLRDLSQWVAWVIISMMALSQRGYQNLEAIKEQSVRLDTTMVRS